MQLEPPQSVLESPDAARALLSGCNLRDPERGWRNLAGVAAALPPNGMRDLGPPLARLLPRCPDPDMALNNLERFFAQPGRRRPAAAAARQPRPHPGDPPAAVRHQPVVQRPARGRPRQPRHAARAAAAQPQRRRDAGPAPGRRGRRLRGLGRPPRLPPLPPAAAAPHRRQRHHPRPAPGGNHPRHLARRRRGPRSRPGRRPAARRQALRPALHRGRPARLLRRPRLRQARRRGAELLQRHRPDVPLRRGGGHARQADFQHRQRRILLPRWSARWSGCCRPTPTAGWPTASTCACGRRGTAAPWPGRWPAPCPTTTRSAAPGSGRRSSRSGRSPATWRWASASSRRSNRSSIANT